MFEDRRILCGVLEEDIYVISPTLTKTSIIRVSGGFS